MKTTLRGREVIDMEIDGIDMKDGPKFVDAFIQSAVWDDNGAELSDNDLEKLSEDSELVWNLVQKRLY